MIVLGYDASPDARRALAAAGGLLNGHGLVVHVWSSALPEAAALAAPSGIAVAPSAMEESERALEQRAREIVDEGVRLAIDAGIDAEPLLLHTHTGTGEVWQALLNVADERHADAIVVGRRGVSRLRSAILGSVSNGLVQHAHRPVLVVPPEDRDDC
jgi:nucleotide-binding universal stress UspA family protein